MEIEHDVFRWLKLTNILQDSHKYRILPNGKVRIDEPTRKLFLNGMKFSQILSNLAIFAKDPKTFIPLQGNSLLPQNTPAARVYNWNLLKTSFNELGIKVDQGDLELIIAGENTQTIHFLNEIWTFVKTKLEKENSEDQEKASFLNIGKKKVVNLASINVEKDYEDTESFLEFIIIAIIKCTQLKLNQVISLLANNQKYLRVLLIKGLNKDFQPLQTFLETIISKLSKIVDLIVEEEQDSLASFLQIIRGGVLSNDFTCNEKSLYILIALAKRLESKGHLSYLKSWFLEENSGFESVLECLGNYPNEFNSLVVHTFYAISSNEIVGLLTSHLKDSINDDNQFFLFINYFLNPLSSDNILHEIVFSVYEDSERRSDSILG